MKKNCEPLVSAPLFAIATTPVVYFSVPLSSSANV